MALQRVSYIQYPVQFQRSLVNKIQALINFSSEVNSMTLTYIAKLGLTFQKTNIGAQKIDGLPLKTHGMALARFLFQDNLGRVSFFEKTFLLVNTSIDVILKMPFLSLNNADVKFAKLEKLTSWRSYMAVKTLLTTCQVKLIDKREFVAAALGRNSGIFVVYIVILKIPTAISIYLLKISLVQDFESTLVAL